MRCVLPRRVSEKRCAAAAAEAADIVFAVVERDLAVDLRAIVVRLVADFDQRQVVAAVDADVGRNVHVMSGRRGRRRWCCRNCRHRGRSRRGWRHGRRRRMQADARQSKRSHRDRDRSGETGACAGGLGIHWNSRNQIVDSLQQRRFAAGHRRRETHVECADTMSGAFGEAFGKRAAVAEMDRGPRIAGNFRDLIEPAPRERRERHEPEQCAPRGGRDLPCRIAPREVRGFVREHRAQRLAIEQLDRPARQQDASAARSDRARKLIEHRKTRHADARFDRERRGVGQELLARHALGARERTLEADQTSRKARERNQRAGEPARDQHEMPRRKRDRHRTH